MGATVTINNSDVAEEADVIVLAVKPHILSQALLTMNASEKLSNKLFVSILAGFKLQTLEKVFVQLQVIQIMK